MIFNYDYIYFIILLYFVIFIYIYNYPETKTSDVNGFQINQTKCIYILKIAIRIIGIKEIKNNLTISINSFNSKMLVVTQAFRRNAAQKHSSGTLGL